MILKNNQLKKGSVYWITGLAGSGKSSVADRFFKKLRAENISVVHLDGDTIRKIFSNKGVSVGSRKKQAKRYSELCKLFSDQGLTVVASFVALFHQIHKWNRLSIDRYFEIFIDVPLEILQERDKKKLYSGVKNKNLKSVVGVNQKAQFPKNPDLIIHNSGHQKAEDSANILYDFHLKMK